MVFEIGVGIVNWMKDILIPIDKAGRVVLPKHLREELDIAPGDMLKISILGNEITLRPKKNKNGFVRRGKALIFSNNGTATIDSQTVGAVLDEVREGRIAQIASSTKGKGKN